MSDKQRKVILSKAVGPKWEREFFLQIQEAILDGWRIAETEVRDDLSLRNFRGRFGRAVFYKDAEATEEPTPTPEKEEEVKAPETAPEPTPEPEIKAEEEAVEEDGETEEKAEEVEIDKAAALKEVEAAPKRKDLVVVAEKYGLTVRENLLHPTALRKDLIEQLS